MIYTRNLRPIESNDLVRIGRANDGGYVVPKTIFKLCDGLLSYGINKDWSFEKDFSKKNPNANIHCYDHSVNFFSLVVFTLKSLILSFLRLLLFDKKRFVKEFSGIFIIPDYYNFFGEKKIYFKKKISTKNEKNCATIEDTFKIISIDSKDIFLKMDIETCEYDVLKSLINSELNFVGLAIEFHKIDQFSEEFNYLIEELLSKYYIVHIHGNNYGKLIKENNFPSTVEITFMNKKHVKEPVKKSSKNYPVLGLDQPNRHSKPDCRLLFD